jgi:hypothetical protein
LAFCSAMFRSTRLSLMFADIVVAARPHLLE